jgi:hypothetical protein
MIGYDGYRGARAATFDATYLIECDIETVAVVDDEKQQLLCLECVW